MIYADDNKNYQFIFGTQYYRAPTPEQENWENDLKHIRQLGFNSVKFWVQWRWANKSRNSYYFDDIDRLMDLAYQNNLKVTLNVIFDVAPQWLYNEYKDCKMVLCNGSIVEPQTVGHRQIGGFPGPCYNHMEALNARKEFLKHTVIHFSKHPALDMWDIWNEPEQCGIYRNPNYNTLSCYCDTCKQKFINTLKDKYKSIEQLNKKWGKCYLSFDDIELPKNGSTFTDFIEYRQFQLDTMTNEAAWRIDTVHQFDKSHPAYLHVVPNTSDIFNALTGVDDFEMSKKCDVFASTNFRDPIWSILTLSAAKGKTCYNVECHIGNGSIRMHQKQIEYADMIRDFAPQIGLGIRGFMFWQFRPEILGVESPAWGVTKLNGQNGSVGIAAERFIKNINPYIKMIMDSKPEIPEIAIWKGNSNEIFSYCVNDEIKTFSNSIKAYVNAFYYNNYNCTVVNDQNIIDGDLSGIKLLILPQCYYMSRKIMSAIDKLIKSGMTVLCEAHLGGYDGDTGRHSYSIPGMGFDEKWGIFEEYTTSSYHLKYSQKTDKNSFNGMSDDVIKAISSYGLSGGKYFPIVLKNGNIIIGANRYAKLSGENLETIGTFKNDACICRKTIGQGNLYYCGTNISEGSSVDNSNFESFLINICKETGIEPNMGINARRGIHIDKINEKLIAVNNTTDEDFILNFGKNINSVFFEDKSDKCNNFSVKMHTADIVHITK